MRFESERLRPLERRHACRARARLLCCWRPRGAVDESLLRLAGEHTRQIHGGIRCVHRASRPLPNVSRAGELGRHEGKRPSRRVEHVRPSVQDRHEVEVVFGHLPLDFVER